MPELQAALADCATAPNTITLAADLADPSLSLHVPCDTTLDLSTYDLTIKSVTIAASRTFTVAGPTDGTGGILTANASGSSHTPGIRTTGATFTVTGGSVHASGGINAGAIGGDTGESAGTLNVAGGAVTATAYSLAYGTAVGGGYPQGGGGVVAVSAGSLYASNAGPYGVAIGGAAAAQGDGGAGATVTVTGGTLTAIATGAYSTAIGGGQRGLNATDRGGAGGSLVIGAGGTVIAQSPRSALGGGSGLGDPAQVGDFGTVQVDGILRLPGGALFVGTGPLPTSGISIGATGSILGGSADPTIGAVIAGPGTIDNQGVIALNASAVTVSGNNRLVTFNPGSTNVRVFAPTFAAGFRNIPAPPAGTQWNTAADGSGAWFTSTSSTAGSGTTTLSAVAPASISVSTDAADLKAVSGVPFTYPVTVLGPSGTPLAPQPPVTFSSTDCVLPLDRVFQAVATCAVNASTVVQGATVSATFTVTIVAGAPAALSLTPSALTVQQGGTLTFTVTGSDAAGNPVDTSAAVLSSSVVTDVVNGRTVTFPTASPHVITATLGAVTASVTVQVTPRPAPSLPSTALPTTGESASPVLALSVAAFALLLGAGLILVRRRPSR